MLDKVTRLLLKVLWTAFYQTTINLELTIRHGITIPVSLPITKNLIVKLLSSFYRVSGNRSKQDTNCVVGQRIA